MEMINDERGRDTGDKGDVREELSTTPCSKVGGERETAAGKT